jgi:hypothetical protein
MKTFWVLMVGALKQGALVMDPGLVETSRWASKEA